MRDKSQIQAEEKLNISETIEQLRADFSSAEWFQNMSDAGRETFLWRWREMRGYRQPTPFLELRLQRLKAEGELSTDEVEGQK